MISRTTRGRIRGVLVATAVAAVTAGTAVVAAPAAVAGGEQRQRFIVTVADGADSRRVAEEHRRNGARVDFVYTSALNGFAGAMSQADLGRLQRDGRVTRIERDGVVTANETQAGATWGLDRIDARSGLDATYTYAHTGTTVTAYIIDTGIRLDHVEFAGRTFSGYDAVDGGSADDCNGHGTHVAGTVGGAAYGVAKEVRLGAVRVLDCNGSGTWSGVIGGLDWVASHHVKPAVANMSLGGGANTSVDDAVRNTIAAGVTVAVAAGNGNQGGKEQDACNYSPARVAEALTIGATTKTDAKTTWSNYGPCVDLFAPGAGITSAWHTDSDDTNTISGTSMATPHVAGVAALYLQQNTGATPAEVAQVIGDATTKGIVTSSKTTNNDLLFSRVPATNAAPVAGFTSQCSGLTCAFTSTSTDSDGTISAYAWDFGAATDSSDTSTAANPEYTFPGDGTYTVSLTVTDDDGAMSPLTTHEVTVANSTGGTEPAVGISLTATAYKVKGVKTADLAWTGATTAVDIYVDDAAAARVVGTVDDEFETLTIGGKGGGSHVLWICETGTTTSCSEKVTVTY